MKILREYIRSLLSEQHGFIGTCVNSFDEDGYCMVPDLSYSTVTDFAWGDENADRIPENEFRSQVIIPPDLEELISGHEIFYLLDRDNNQYMLYDSDDDIHYFFGGR